MEAACDVRSLEPSVCFWHSDVDVVFVIQSMEPSVCGRSVRMDTKSSSPQPLYNPQWLTGLNTPTNSFLLPLFSTPQRRAAYVEIKVPSGENAELKRSPFKVWGRSINSSTCYAYCQGFLLAFLYPFGPFTCIFSKTSLDFILCWLWLTPVPV